jgi:hypothetical protein
MSRENMKRKNMNGELTLLSFFYFRFAHAWTCSEGKGRHVTFFVSRIMNLLA